MRLIEHQIQLILYLADSYFKKDLNEENQVLAHPLVVLNYNTRVKELNGGKYPRGYKLQDNDNWCAAFISVLFSSQNIVGFPYECSVQEMYNLIPDECKRQVIGDTEILEGDLVFYEWTPQKPGWLDHVGIVSGFSSNYAQIIEGNKNNSVGIRTIQKEWSTGGSISDVVDTRKLLKSLL